MENLGERKSPQGKTVISPWSGHRLLNCAVIVLDQHKTTSTCPPWSRSNSKPRLRRRRMGQEREATSPHGLRTLTGTRTLRAPTGLRSPSMTRPAARSACSARHHHRRSTATNLRLRLAPPPRPRTWSVVLRASTGSRSLLNDTTARPKRVFRKTPPLSRTKAPPPAAYPPKTLTRQSTTSRTAIETRNKDD